MADQHHVRRRLLLSARCRAHGVPDDVARRWRVEPAPGSGKQRRYTYEHPLVKGAVFHGLTEARVALLEALAPKKPAEEAEEAEEA